ncbi:MAG: hypothetical protein WCH46_09070 [bacterium]
MLNLLFITLRWTSILLSLSSDPAEDQFGQEVQWRKFSSKPFVLVIADRSASELAVQIGAVLHIQFNGVDQPAQEHLLVTNQNERLKVIPVAALPYVPGIFKWLFRKGFRSEAKTGVILDWDNRIARLCGYQEGKVRLVLKLPNSEEVFLADVNSPTTALSFIKAQFPSTTEPERIPQK